MTQDFLFGLAVNAVVAFIIRVVAIWLSGWAKARIERLADRSDRIDRTLAGFLGSLARYGILALAVIFILGRFGIQTASLAALIGAVGLALGLALQGSLGNLAAGVLLIAFRPFKTGDYVEAGGKAGTVDAITLFTTELTTPDNVKIIVPNGDVFAGPITNFSHYADRRCDLVFGVGYGSNLKTAEQAIRDCIARDMRARTDPEPFVKVTTLGDSSVDFTVRVWCASAEYWNLKFDLTRAVKEEFDAKGIEIPFPTRTQITVAG